MCVMLASQLHILMPELLRDYCHRYTAHGEPARVRVPQNVE
jgi:hypothetical protein